MITVAEHGTKLWQPGNDRPEECVPLEETTKLTSSYKRKQSKNVEKKIMKTITKLLHATYPHLYRKV